VQGSDEVMQPNIGRLAMPLPGMSLLGKPRMTLQRMMIDVALIAVGFHAVIALPT
jgi:hypothetical protein